jgi:hypothetical protein
LVALALAAPCASAAQAQAAAAGAGGASKRAAHHRSRRSGLEDRVAMLTKALDLDAKQQLALRKVLEREREQVREVWSDTSVAPALRVAATQAIGDRTADQVRALLNDEQKKRYNPPRQVHEAAGSSRSIEDWMTNGKAK